MPALMHQSITTALGAVLLVPAIAAAQLGDRSARTMVSDPKPFPVLSVDTTSPRVGPPPQGISFEAAKTYGIFAKIVWNPAPNVREYWVSRGKRDDAICCNATSGALPGSESSWTDVGLFKPGYYRYTVTAIYTDGSVGKESIDLIHQDGAAPTVEVLDLRPGQVRLDWHKVQVAGTCCVRITGPGLGPTGEKLVLGGGPLDLPILPAGTHKWTFAAAYKVNTLPVQPATNYGVYQAYGETAVVLAPPSEWTEVSHTVRYGSGRFRISLEGFKAISVTAEDPFRSDGRGDEVFITTQVSEYWRNGTLTSTRSLRTPTFGDRHNFPSRVQAGSASPDGGIMPNDAYPVIPQLVSQLKPATTTNLPYLLWEGELTEIDNAVILAPTIWESDLGDELVIPYANFLTNDASTLGHRAELHDYIPNTYGQPVLSLWKAQQSCPAWISQPGSGCAYAFVPPFGGWHDEPVDMNADHSHTPTYVAINWKIADDLTRVNPATVMSIPIKNKHTGWEYTLYIRIEKVAPAPVVAPRAMRRAGP